jgi:putative transposase
VSRPGRSTIWSALGVDSGISKSEVSRICAGLDEVVTAFRTRRLDHTESPTSISTRPTCTSATPPPKSSRWPWSSPPGSPLTAAARSLSSRGLDVGDSEDEVFWRAFLTDLKKKRGLGGLRLVISDQHAGLVAALKRSFWSASFWPTCTTNGGQVIAATSPKAPWRSSNPTTILRSSPRSTYHSAGHRQPEHPSPCIRLPVRVLAPTVPPPPASALF